MPEGKTSSLTAVLLLIPTVELTCYAGRSSSMPRSLTICPEVDSGRSWRLGALTAPASSQAVEQSWERPGVLARSLRHFCCVLAAHHSSHIPRHCSLKAHVSQRQERKKTKPRVPRLPKFPSLSVPVRLAHIEDGCEDSLEEKRDGLYSTETWLCACIIENERLRRCRLLHHKRGALSQLIACAKAVS